MARSVPSCPFVPKGSEMRQVLDSAGMADFACDEFDVAGGTAALERLWDRYQAGTLSGNADTSAVLVIGSANVALLEYR